MQTDTSDLLIEMRTHKRISLVTFVFSRQMKESVAKVSIQMLFSGSIKFRATTSTGARGVESRNMNMVKIYPHKSTDVKSNLWLKFIHIKVDL